MRIDLKEVTNVLDICNVNVYEMYMETEYESITIEVDEIDSIDMDTLIDELEDMNVFYDVEVVGNNIYCSYNDDEFFNI